jgi:hypothetical protein
MTDSMLLLIFLCLGEGILITWLQHKLYQHKEQLDECHELVIAMAKELESLGSPNVKVFRE